MIYVSDLMTSRVFTLRRTDTLQDVRSLMQLAKIRHIPVTEDGDRFVGLLTHRDLLGYAVSHLAEINREEQEEIESSILVGDIMQTDVRTVAPDTLLREVAEILIEWHGCLLVLDGDNKLLHHYRSRFPAPAIAWYDADLPLYQTAGASSSPSAL
ncbi:MAG: CBS domain-containing protein [Bilophila wadsworthia]